MSAKSLIYVSISSNKIYIDSSLVLLLHILLTLWFCLGFRWVIPIIRMIKIVTKFVAKSKIVNIVKGKQFTKAKIILLLGSKLESNPQSNKRIYVIETLRKCTSIPYLTIQEEKKKEKKERIITISTTENHINENPNFLSFTIH